MSDNTKVAELPAKLREKAKRIRGMIAGSNLVEDIMEGAAEELEAALARQEADKTKAAIWIEFAENGNIRFWTSDQDRAIEESFCHARSLTAYYAAPPAAQAVDLGQFRGAVEAYKAAVNEDCYFDPSDYDDNIAYADRLLALIDQQAGKAGGA